MLPQEIILSACSTSTPGAGPSRPNTSLVPSIQAHDLLTCLPLHSYKSSTSALHSLSYVPSRNGQGGTIMAVQENKSLLYVWAWQKDQMLSKLHLPDKLTCFSISPNGVWATGGSPGGQIYLWELASGTLLSSFSAHYRQVVSLTFTPDSRLLLSASLDGSIHIHLVARLAEADHLGKPYGTLRDHTLAIRDVVVGKTSGVHGGRCWTISDDGTVKMWDLHPPFDLLCTFSLTPASIPTALVVDSSERFFYVSTSNGDIFYVPLFRRRDEVGGLGAVEAVGGGVFGSSAVKLEGGRVISLKTAITALALSITASHLLVGTVAGTVQIHSLPSHQHLSTISLPGPCSYISTLPRPPDMPVGPSTTTKDLWPVMEVKPLERVKNPPSWRTREASILLRADLDRLDSLRSVPVTKGNCAGLSVAVESQGTRYSLTEEKLRVLQEENTALREGLERATRINETMWRSIVDGVVESESS